MKDSLAITPMQDFDIEASLQLWRVCEGMCISSADEIPQLVAFLARNPGMSFVAYAHQTETPQEPIDEVDKAAIAITSQAVSGQNVSAMTSGGPLNKSLEYGVPGSLGRLVATALCGTDGRRGYLYHVAVEAAYRNKGLGKMLVELCMESLAHIGIKKCHAMVLADNPVGIGFWQKLGWTYRTDIALYSQIIGE